MERKVGGKTLEELFQMLLADIPGVIKEMEENGNPYLDGTRLREHFNRIVPLQNYKFLVTEPKLNVYDGAACYTCKGTIILYDDEGLEVTRQEYVGSKNVGHKKNGSVMDMEMIARNAADNARKNCIQLFGCGVRQLKEAKAAAKANTRQRNSGGQGNYSQNNRGNFPVSQNMPTPPMGKGRFALSCLKGPIKDMPKLVLLPVMLMDSPCKGYKTQLLLWKSSCDAPDLVKKFSSGGVFWVHGTFERYAQDYRIVFDSMAQSGAA